MKHGTRECFRPSSVFHFWCNQCVLHALFTWSMEHRIASDLRLVPFVHVTTAWFRHIGYMKKQNAVQGIFVCSVSCNRYWFWRHWLHEWNTGLLQTMLHFHVTMACSTCIAYMKCGTLDCFKPCSAFSCDHGLVETHDTWSSRTQSKAFLCLGFHVTNTGFGIALDNAV